MTIQLYENKGDLLLSIKGAPLGMKKMLEEAFATMTVRELKCLLKDPEPMGPLPEEEGWNAVTEETDCPFVRSDDEDYVRPQKKEDDDDYVNENLPFKKPEKVTEEEEEEDENDKWARSARPYDPFA